MHLLHSVIKTHLIAKVAFSISSLALLLSSTHIYFVDEKQSAVNSFERTVALQNILQSMRAHEYAFDINIGCYDALILIKKKVCTDREEEGEKEREMKRV